MVTGSGLNDADRPLACYPWCIVTNCLTTQFQNTMADAKTKDRTLPLDALQKALTSNQNLQSHTMSELERIGSLKAKNRRRAAVLSLRRADASTPFAAIASTTTRTVTLPSCEWTDEYFFEPKSKSVPEPNEDAVRRTKVEAQHFFATTHPYWQKPENRRLLECVEEATTTTTTSRSNGGSLDFVEIARKVSSADRPRSAEECRIQTRNLQKKKRAWKAEEVKRLRKIIDEQQQQQGNPNGNTTTLPKIDWQQISAKFGASRTPWELFQVYIDNIIGKPKRGAWTPEADELLLKYTAAMGPQFLIDGALLGSMATRFLPDMNREQIFSRINHSLVNPNLKNQAWGEEDERKLALCMKVYSESESRKALHFASGHLPWRATSSVGDKWERSLNPAFSGDPFSKKEDAELMKVMRANPNLGWKAVSQKYFPKRHPHRLMNRWSEIATDKDILDRYNDQLLKDRQDAAENRQTEADASEYIVQVKKARRS